MVARLELDVICKAAEHGRHMHFVPTPLNERQLRSFRAKCTLCGMPIRAKGARWASEFYIIDEDEDVSDLPELTDQLRRQGLHVAADSRR